MFQLKPPSQLIIQKSITTNTDVSKIIHLGTKEEIASFSILVPNYELFFNLQNESNLVYTEYKNYGLCEYIALISLFNYFQLYGKNDYYKLGQIPDNIYKGPKTKSAPNVDFDGGLYKHLTKIVNSVELNNIMNTVYPAN
ncbi:hypothetical protein EELLY_v1c03560 [Entomoplasma ellychniae]|uniref:Uncharacterized protein n=1 Tax=Entomoplasma ellychniae TaxID=2114 RepID=A0A8E2QVY2_9MOLU|nr:hypothetical protein [Entomoplasma ellychniae]PPE04676.1 hypothetical protein EELLY_v1c03560 [Entomoplasma ellychniae]